MKAVSIITACKNREFSLRVSLMTWMQFKEVAEIIITDWSSDKSLSYLTEWDKRIKVIRVPNQKYYNQPQPLNIAASVASSQKILKLDNDHILNPYYNFFKDYKINETSFLTGMNIEPQDVYFGLFGMLYVHRKNFWNVGGYNENFGKYYSYEDDDMIHRLQLSGLEMKKIIPETNRMIHMPHPNNRRVEHFEGDAEINDYEVKLRKKMSERFSGWSLDKRVGDIMSSRHNYTNRMKFDIKNVKEPFVQRKYHWNVEKINDQEYRATPA
jgi:predicted glycosyltransferase involved in capsule biosynthesis